MKDYEKMTVKELVDELTNLGVTFNKKSRKAELIELLLAETKGKETAKKEDKPEAGAKSAPEKTPAKRLPPRSKVLSLKKAPRNLQK